jgi:hypothetical protein
MDPECSAEQLALSRPHDLEESSLYSRSYHNLKFRTSRLELFMRPILWERIEGCNSEGVYCLEVSVRARAVWAWLIACSVGCCCCCQIFRNRLHWNEAVNLALLSIANTRLQRDVYILISNFPFVVPNWLTVLWHCVYPIRYVCIVPWLAVVCCGVTVGSQNIYTVIFTELFTTYSCPLLYSAPIYVPLVNVFRLFTNCYQQYSCIMVTIKMKLNGTNWYSVRTPM